MKTDKNNQDLYGVAIVGMAGRFPQADNINVFWSNLTQGSEGVSFYSDDELIKAGVPDDLIAHPDYIKARAGLDGTELFDASFFGINRREAEIMDPQHRLLLECSWEALENSGYDPEKFNGSIGIYAGKSMGGYAFFNVFPQLKKWMSSGSLQAAIGNDKDSMTTTVAYHLNLKGPAISIQSSSSTSLVAVCLACQSLLTYQCDMALAGGVSAGPPLKNGYLYEEGGIMSSDGHCRPFDAQSNGFVPGDGVGLVVLKRLEDAVHDKDHIWAVIKGFAVNNDGSSKVSYSAPSVDSQSQVVVAAQAVADVHPETISYIEAHGTGTNLGDPIELAALTQAFRARTDKKQFCAIGSVKSNIGHLDTAAGVAGLIKVALSLKHKTIPPTINYSSPNPNIDFNDSPFYVNTETMDWPFFGGPRRAGITSLGMGGTNAHVVLEEAPTSPEKDRLDTWQIVPISGKSQKALSSNCNRLVEHLKANYHERIEDIAFTLQMGRREFSYRRAIVCQNVQSLIKVLEKNQLEEVSPCATGSSRPVVFMFTGQGTQYLNMGQDLYKEQIIFRQNIDLCATILLTKKCRDIRSILYPSHKAESLGQKEDIEQTSIAQPLIFAFEYALAQLWISLGVKPSGMIGHSLGELVAATLAGVFSLEDALSIVASRAEIMQKQKTGSMLAVEMNEFDVDTILDENISLAAVNSPRLCVVSGAKHAIMKLSVDLSNKGVFSKELSTSHAFHSRMMEPALEEFKSVIQIVKLQRPKLPFVSCVTGDWISDDEATDPQYWADQLVVPVRFKDGMRTLLRDSTRVYLEIGPGDTLCQLTLQQKNNTTNLPVVASTRSSSAGITDKEALYLAAAKLWSNGVIINWNNYHSSEFGRRIPLPTYSFERVEYWIKSENEKKAESHNEKTICQKSSPPAGITEQVSADDVVSDIWEELLGKKPLGPEDNFFDAGGDSLLATQFLSRIKDKFQIRLSLRSILENPTITSINKQISSASEDRKEMRTIADIIEDIKKSEITHENKNKS